MRLLLDEMYPAVVAEQLRTRLVLALDALLTAGPDTTAPLFLKAAA